MPIDFYSLSLELRQKILIDSFEEPLANDIAFNLNLTRLYQVILFDRDARSFYFAPHISAWANTLKSTHPMMSQDLGFVIQTMLRAVEVKPLSILSELIPRTNSRRNSVNKWERWYWMMSASSRLHFLVNSRGGRKFRARRYCITQSKECKRIVLQKVFGYG